MHPTTNKPFCTLMGEYLHKWGIRAEALRSKDWSDLGGLEQLYKICLPDMEMWLVDKKPEELQRAGRLGDEFVDSRSGYGTGPKGDWPRLGVQKGSHPRAPQKEDC